MEKHKSHIINPRYAAHIAKYHDLTVEEYRWAVQMASYYRAVPLDKENEWNFYRFLMDVFNAGVISGKREERAKRRGRA